jgi:hypothetical protein
LAICLWLRGLFVMVCLLIDNLKVQWDDQDGVAEWWSFDNMCYALIIYVQIVSRNLTCFMIYMDEVICFMTKQPKRGHIFNMDGVGSRGIFLWLLCKLLPNICQEMEVANDLSKRFVVCSQPFIVSFIACFPYIPCWQFFLQWTINILHVYFSFIREILLTH